MRDDVRALRVLADVTEGLQVDGLLQGTLLPFAREKIVHWYKITCSDGVKLRNTGF